MRIPLRVKKKQRVKKNQRVVPSRQSSKSKASSKSNEEAKRGDKVPNHGYNPKRSKFKLPRPIPPTVDIDGKCSAPPSESEPDLPFSSIPASDGLPGWAEDLVGKAEFLKGIIKSFSASFDKIEAQLKECVSKILVLEQRNASLESHLHSHSDDSEAALKKKREELDASIKDVMVGIRDNCSQTSEHGYLF